MECPLCGIDHIISSDLLPSRPSEYFVPCPDCNKTTRPKDSPVTGSPEKKTCNCGRRPIDEVMAEIWLLLKESGVLMGNEPLSDIGTPLINPGVFLVRPPVLPPRSLILITDKIPEEAALFMYEKVPEVMGIILRSGNVPGTGDLMCGSPAEGFSDTLLCGCDMRADVFPTSHGPVLITKIQHAIHVEFPNGLNLKVRSVESNLQRTRADVFIDACSGPGTLGIVAALFGVREVIMCDVWYASAFCAGYNLLVNQKKLGLPEIRFLESLDKMPKVRYGRPELVCEARGENTRIRVFHGPYEGLPPILPEGIRLTAFDPFDKNAFSKNDKIMSLWRATVGGEAFIP